MNGWLILLIGIAIGWLIELCIDYLFWRRRNICPETVAAPAAGAAGGSRGAFAAYGQSSVAFTRDNLQMIWGIGPKIEAALVERGITRFQQLAEIDLQDLQQILVQVRFPLAKYEDLVREWQRQARYAAAGQVEALARAVLVLVDKVKRLERVNLEQVWGIGKAREQELYDLGVSSLEALVEADLATLRPVLVKLTRAYSTESLDEIYEAVITQARLALFGYWGRLEGFKAQYRSDEQRFDDLSQLALIDDEVQQALRTRYYITSWQQLAEIDIAAVKELRQAYHWEVSSGDEELLAALQELARLQAEGKTSEFSVRQAEMTRALGAKSYSN